MLTTCVHWFLGMQVFSTHFVTAKQVDVKFKLNEQKYVKMFTANCLFTQFVVYGSSGVLFHQSIM